MSASTLVLIALASLFAALVLAYLVSRHRLRAMLAAGSRIAQTSVDPVEYLDLGAGPVVMHVHGMLGGADHRRFGEFLVRAGFRLVVPSRPGYLRTPLAAGRTPAEQAELYAALLDKLGIQQVALYAISQGGASSLEFALAYPDRCWGLVLVSAFTRPLQMDALKRILPYLRALMALDFVMWLLEPVLLPWLMREAERALPEADRQDAAKMAGIREFLGAALQASLRGQGLTNDVNNCLHWDGLPLEQMRAPALVVHGTTDALIHCENSVTTARQIPDATFVPLAGAGHEAFITRADQIEPVILKFLRAHTHSRKEEANGPDHL